MQSDIFNLAADIPAPLAARMRPTEFEQYHGQQHILGQGKPLRQMLDKGRCYSLILWGPPGTGKTTLAELIALKCNAQIIRLSAVMAGVKDIREAMVQAQQNRTMGQATLLFVDEVHRFNKSQQDAFLPYIEDGTITFVGATTENPSFEINNALLSRVKVHILQRLSNDDVTKMVEQALNDSEQGLGELNISIADDALAALVDIADGDGRMSLNLIEQLAELAQANEVSVISLALVKDVVPNRVAKFDKGGDQFYDLISAYHKSVRGSDPDAALYWYCRILAGGGDPLYVARRLLAIATEDIGNADPRAMDVALNAWDIFHRVGPSEGERAIAQATLYLAAAAKSNAVYDAFNQAKQLAQDTSHLDVPIHLRNAPTNLLKEMGHGAEYRYAHNEPGAFAEGENYFPESIKDTSLYQPSDRGLEKKIQQKLDYLLQRNVNSQNKRYPE